MISHIMGIWGYYVLIPWSTDHLHIPITSPSPHTASQRWTPDCLAPICCRCRRLKVACATARAARGARNGEPGSDVPVEGWFFVLKATVKTCEIPRNIRKMMKNWGFPTPKQISSGQTLPPFWAKYGCPPLAIQFLRIVSERIDRYWRPARRTTFWHQL